MKTAGYRTLIHTIATFRDVVDRLDLVEDWLGSNNICRKPSERLAIYKRHLERPADADEVGPDELTSLWKDAGPAIRSDVEIWEVTVRNRELLCERILAWIRPSRPASG